VNYGTRYPRGVKRPRGFFPDDGVTRVHIRVNPATVRRDEQSAMHPATPVGLTLFNRRPIPERALGGVACCAHVHAEANPFRLVGPPLDEAGRREAHQVLIGPASQVDLLLPTILLADEQCGHAFVPQPRDDPATGELPVLRHPPMAEVGPPVETLGGGTPRQTGVEFRAPLVGIWVDGFQGAALHDDGHRTRLV